MCEKRFELTFMDCFYITDHQTKDYASVLEEDLEEIVDLLNDQNELIQQGFEELAKANDEKFEYEMKVKEILQKHYDIFSKKYAQGKSVTRERSGIKLELLELLADELGVDLE